jgi:hypothetical protein
MHQNRSQLHDGLPVSRAIADFVYYDEENVPEARFSYDLSPMSASVCVAVEKKGRTWYDYLTPLCAIIGGTFTTLGLIDATLYKTFKPKKLYCSWLVWLVTYYTILSLLGLVRLADVGSSWVHSKALVRVYTILLVYYIVYSIRR